MLQRLTPMETRLFEAMMADEGHVWTVEQLAEVAYREKERPPSWRNGVIATMKSLRLKTLALRSNRVVRVSKARGRGNVGKYALGKTAAKHGFIAD